MRGLIAGNWKMNGTGAALAELETLAAALPDAARGNEIVICPPATLLDRAAAMAGGRFALGGQDCRAEAAGAFTGDISAEMLRDAGAGFVIVGHSERRQFHGEICFDVSAKARAAWRAGLTAIICIGETGAQRDAGEAKSVCEAQVMASVPEGARAGNVVLSYEPVWAIGTGRTPHAKEIAAMHAHIRACLTRRAGDEAKGIRILYGGSVNPGNAGAILAVPDVNGALVGGASLKARDFLAIMAAAPRFVG